MEDTRPISERYKFFEYTIPEKIKTVCKNCGNEIIMYGKHDIIICKHCGSVNNG